MELEFLPDNKTRDPWAKKEELVLYESSYYTLVWTLIFDIIFKTEGFTKAFETIKQMPMSLITRQELVSELKQLYESKIWEVSLIHGEKAVEKVKNRHLNIEIDNTIEEEKQEISNTISNPILESRFWS